MDGVPKANLLARVAVPAAVVALASCSPGSTARAEARIATSGGGVTLRVTVADSDPARQRGLMGVTDLAADGGMAFLFDQPVRASFWMKDTPLPLSIAFWGRDGRIVAVLDMPPCATDPCPTYRPDADFVGALEAHRGFFERHGVEVGDHVAIVR
jgi:uncharacterized membrane protein (UPF0127 family)